MLSDNIRHYRKKLNLSQDELAEKIGVSRQSVSFWETGQTQPTIENIVVLSKVFNISTDVLLLGDDSAVVWENEVSDSPPPTKNDRSIFYIIIVIFVVAVICGVMLLMSLADNKAHKANSDAASTSTEDTGINDNSSVSDDIPAAVSADPTSDTAEASVTATSETTTSETTTSETTTSEVTTTEATTFVTTTATTTELPEEVIVDLFKCCKNFAIENGILNGDFCMYQQPAVLYGGYENEYFSISYWGDSDMVEFCLHCPLDETLSHNFYLRMKGGLHGQYEYVSSKYFRDTGASLRYARGYINPVEFSDSIPISCEQYLGDSEGQNKFMEDSRVGLCDLISCLKVFVEVEDMDCDFYDFNFVNF